MNLPLNLKFTLFIIGILFSAVVKSQESKTIYYDENWKEINNKEKASYYRKIETDPVKSKHFLVKDYYITGEIQMEAQMTSLDPEIMDGDVSYYFKNGKKHTERTYSNGKQNGNHKEWYENGVLEDEGPMQNGLANGEWRYYYANGKVRMSGNIINGKKQGSWVINTLEGNNYLKHEYKNGTLIKIELTDKSKGLYEYMTEVDSGGGFKLTPFVAYNSSEEYRLAEPFIRDNINFLQTCNDGQTFQVTYAYTLIWLTNSPYLGKFQINANKFMVDYVTELEESYKYEALMTKMYILGLGVYYLDNEGKINDTAKFHEQGANVMLNYYRYLKTTDLSQKSEKLENLLDLQKKGKLAAYIKNY